MHITPSHLKNPFISKPLNEIESFLDEDHAAADEAILEAVVQMSSNEIVVAVRNLHARFPSVALAIIEGIQALFPEEHPFCAEEVATLFWGVSFIEDTHGRKGNNEEQRHLRKQCSTAVDWLLMSYQNLKSIDMLHVISSARRGVTQGLSLYDEIFAKKIHTWEGSAHQQLENINFQIDVFINNTMPKTLEKRIEGIKSSESMIDKFYADIVSASKMDTPYVKAFINVLGEIKAAELITKYVSYEENTHALLVGCKEINEDAIFTPIILDYYLEELENNRCPPSLNKLAITGYLLENCPKFKSFMLDNCSKILLLCNTVVGAPLSVEAKEEGRQADLIRGALDAAREFHHKETGSLSETSTEVANRILTVPRGSVGWQVKTDMLRDVVISSLQSMDIRNFPEEIKEIGAKAFSQLYPYVKSRRLSSHQLMEHFPNAKKAILSNDLGM
jgi:hypothetical protein